jgi:hypothetical protein
MSAALLVFVSLSIVFVSVLYYVFFMVNIFALRFINVCAERHK